MRLRQQSHQQRAGAAEISDRVSTPEGNSHVERSIEGPGAYDSTRSPDFIYIASNLTGAFQLLQAVSSHREQLPSDRKAAFRIHHISTDDVFGSLGETGRFSETTP